MLYLRQCEDHVSQAQILSECTCFLFIISIGENESVRIYKLNKREFIVLP